MCPKTSASLVLRLLGSSSVLSSWHLDSTTVRTWLVVDLSAGLDGLLELLVAISDSLEELCLDLSSKGGGLSLELVLCGLLLDRLGELLSLAFGSVEVLLTLELTLEDGAHNLLLLWIESVVVQRAAHAHHRHSTVAVTDCGHGATDLNGSENGVRDLLRVGDLILTVEEVPHVQETVHTGQEEKTWTGWRPASIGEVCRVVARRHDRVRLEILRPDLGGPVTNGQEVLQVAWVSLDVVDWAVMLALIKSELQVDFDLLSLVCLEDVALLSTDEVLERRGVSVVLKGGATKNLRLDLTVDRELLFKLELLCGTGIQVLGVPPKQATVSRCGNTLNTGFARDPGDVIDWVMMGLLKNRSSSGLDGATCTFLGSAIKDADATVVGATDDQITVLLRESKSAKR